MYKNSEGYNDPTAGVAISHLMAANCRGYFSSGQEYKGKPKVYIVSPYAGAVERNRAAAIRYCQYVISHGKIPVASHLMYPQILDDDIPLERELGLVFGLELLAVCDEIWVFGKRISSGMEKEIQEAERIGKPIRFIEEVEGK